MAIDFTTWDFSWVYWPGFEIMTIIYFIAFGVINICYAIKSRDHPEKRDNPKFFINEVAIGILFLILAGLYPFLWDNIVPNDYVKAQMYFHLWDTLTVQLIGWPIYILIATWNDKRKNRKISYDDWKQQQLEKYHSSDKGDFMTNLKRKLQHILPGGVVIGFYYLALANKDSLANINWTVMTGAMYFTAAVGLTFAFIMNIFDLVRLLKWDWLGKFARSWANGALLPDELNTTTSASPMVLAFVPFFLFPQKQFLFAICLISGISDAMASIIGKKFGKRKSGKNEKTVAGYIAGAVSTYLLVLLTHVILPFTEINLVTVHIMAAVTAFSFFAVDYFARYLSDNILNSVVCGGAMALVYFLAVAI